MSETFIQCLSGQDSFHMHLSQMSMWHFPSLSSMVFSHDMVMARKRKIGNTLFINVHMCLSVPVRFSPLFFSPFPLIPNNGNKEIDRKKYDCQHIQQFL